MREKIIVNIGKEKGKAKAKDKAKDYLLYRVALCWAAEWWSAGD